MWAYVLVGIAVGAGIHGYVPTDALAGYMGKDAAWWSVPLVVFAALPLYSNAAGMAPVLQALVEKGAALGTALAFMMAVVGVSLPETILLRRVLKPPLIAIFVGVVTAGDHPHGLPLQRGPMKARPRPSLSGRTELEAAMPLVTVFRRIPPPIVGTVGVVHDRGFEAFEERLDWLESAGVPVERFDPIAEPGEVAARETVRKRLSMEGERCLPLILLNDTVVLEGGYPSRAQLARAVGRNRCLGPR